MKLISWNLNGIRAVAQKGLLSIINDFQADIICFQETKAQDDQVKEVLNQLEGYHIAVSSADKKGYSGTAILSKIRPVSVQYGLNIAEHDNEGRLITAEFDNFYLLTVYVPNSQNELARLPYRTKWDADLLAYIKTLNQKKPVIICGDMNVAHQPIDLANPKANFNKTAGYTQQEIEGMDNFIKAGFTDSFRALYPSEIKYSWWSYRFNSRAKNIGWRIDYFLLSDRLVPGLNDAFIMNEVEGSDHCPVGITINL
jgi:exodeoxyribonuclease III